MPIKYNYKIHEGHSELNCGVFGQSEFILSHRFNYENVMHVFEYKNIISGFILLHFNCDSEVPAVGTGYSFFTRAKEF